jgi:ankyrin repeat protein
MAAAVVDEELTNQLKNVRIWIEQGQYDTELNQLVQDTFRLAKSELLFKIMHDLIVVFGFDVNSTWCTEEMTFLQMACMLKRVDWVKFLLQQGANIAVQDIHGKTPLTLLHCAFESFMANVNDDIMLLLLNYGGGYLDDYHLNIALYYTIKKRNYSLLTSMLKHHGVKPAQQQFQRCNAQVKIESPFVFAANLKDLKSLALLVEYDRSENLSPRREALTIACREAKWFDYYYMVLMPETLQVLIHRLLTN